jgi:flagellar basal-body rod modification protein FlgD
MTNPVSNTPAPANGAGSSDTSNAKNALNANYQDFLKLLTTQLQNQDPTAPADTNQITQEIAMLSQVEQQINSNKNLEKLISLMTTGQTNAAVGYIGMNIDATGNQTVLSNSQATLVYTLPSDAASSTVTISNAAGQTVFSGPGSKVAGRNQVVWDGTNNMAGGKAADGVYKFTITAKDSAGKDVKATTFTTGIVTAVDSQDGKTNLSLGGVSVPIEDVQTIYIPGTNPGV